MALQRRHDKRQKMESSAVAGKEDEEVSSDTATLHLGSPRKRSWENYVCPGHPHCENFDCDVCANPSEIELEDVKEDDEGRPVRTRS